MPKDISVNQNFFKRWSPTMAYVIGFFTADGCLTINPRGSHYIEFVNNDLDVIKKIRKTLGSNHKIGTRVRINPRWNKSYRIQIGSKMLFNDLQRIGFTVNKTSTIKLPRIPKEYFADYLRGYFDGDGCINYGTCAYQGRKKLKYHILFRLVCKNKKFLEDLAAVIKRLIKTNGQTIFLHQGAFSLAYSTKDSLKILHFIYNKPTIYLNRKFKSSKKATQNYYEHLDR